MSQQQGQDQQGLQHQVDTLKRIVLRDDFITIISAVSQSEMATPAEIDISSYVSATATAAVISLFIMPTATSYWSLRAAAPGVNQLFAHTHAINIWGSNYGLVTLSSSKTFSYYAKQITGGGKASWMVRLHGYIEKA